jgi:hypothetical protein
MSVCFPDIFGKSYDQIMNNGGDVYPDDPGKITRNSFKRRLHIFPVLNGLNIAYSPGRNLGGIGLIGVQVHIHPEIGMYANQDIAKNQFPDTLDFNHDDIFVP